MLRHMEREEPQGEETAADAAMAAAAFHQHQLAARGLIQHHHQHQLSGAGGANLRPGPPGATPTTATPVFGVRPGLPGGGGGEFPLGAMGQKASVQEELMAAKIAAAARGGQQQLSPMMPPRLSTPTAPGQLLESSLLNNSKLNPSVYAHPGFGGDPVLNNKLGGPLAGGGQLGAYPLAVLGGRKDNVDVTSSGAFFDQKAANKPKRQAGQSDMISHLTREMKLQQQQQQASSSSSDLTGSANNMLSGSSELGSSNGGSNQQLSQGGGGGAGGKGVTSSSASSLLSASTKASSTAAPAGRTTSTSSSSGYRSDNSIGFESKELSVAVAGAAAAAAAAGGAMQNPMQATTSSSATTLLTGSNPAISDLKQQQQQQQRHRNSIPSVANLGIIPSVGLLPPQPSNTRDSQDMLNKTAPSSSSSSAAHLLMGPPSSSSDPRGLNLLSRSQPDLTGMDAHQHHLQQQQQQLGHLGLLGGVGDFASSSMGAVGFGAGMMPNRLFHPLGAPSAVELALQEGDLEKVLQQFIFCSNLLIVVFLSPLSFSKKRIAFFAATSRICPEESPECRRWSRKWQRYKLHIK